MIEFKIINDVTRIFDISQENIYIYIYIPVDEKLPSEGS